MEKAHSCKVVLVLGLVELLASYTRSLRLAEGRHRKLLALSVEVVAVLYRIRPVMALSCNLQAPTEAQETVFYILQVPMEAQGTVFHILQVQMAALVKAVFHSLERTDFFYIQRAHHSHHIARGDFLEDSH